MLRSKGENVVHVVCTKNCFGWQLEFNRTTLYRWISLCIPVHMVKINDPPILLSTFFQLLSFFKWVITLNVWVQ